MLRKKHPFLNVNIWGKENEKFSFPRKVFVFCLPHLRLPNDSLQISSLPPLLFLFFFVFCFLKISFPPCWERGQEKTVLSLQFLKLSRKKKRGKKRKVAYSQPIIYRNELHLWSLNFLKFWGSCFSSSPAYINWKV